MTKILKIVVLLLIASFAACDFDEPKSKRKKGRKKSKRKGLQPVLVTEKVEYDSDDPAIWINRENPEKSLILGTDKHRNGALFVFDLEGNILEDKSVYDLGRPNNVDVEYDVVLDDGKFDLAVVTERNTQKLRVFTLPDMRAVDGGGLRLFEDADGSKDFRLPMGVALYRRASDEVTFAIVSRKAGPSDGYLWQYRISGDGHGRVSLQKERAFGNWSGKGEIEAIAVDDQAGFVYYSDESYGVRKYHADPDQNDANKELAVLGRRGFEKDREGLSIYAPTDSTGYIVVSDQQADSFHIFSRFGTKDDPHEHKRLKIVRVAAEESDGSDVTHLELNQNFPGGLFVAMSSDRRFHYYSWESLWR